MTPDTTSNSRQHQTHPSGVERLPVRRGHPVLLQRRYDLAPVAVPVPAEGAEVAACGGVHSGVVETRRLRLLSGLRASTHRIDDK